MVFHSQKLLNLLHIKHGFFSRKKTIDDYLKDKDLVCLRQKHSSICHFIDQSPKGRLTGDALITQNPKFVLCIKTADCAPLLIAHKTHSIVAAIHAGWRGAIFEKIIENTAEILKRFDSLSNYIVAVGPCLHQKHFEVGDVIYNNVACKKYFTSKRYFNFPLFIQDKLEQLGFDEIDNVNLDTYSNEQDFFSFRRSTHKKEDSTGRQWSAISINHH